MALTKEDLLAIKSVVDDSVSELKSDVVGLKGEVKGLGKRVDSLETEVKGLSERMDSVEGEIVGLKGEVKGLSQRMDSVENEVKGLSHRMDSVENEVKGISHRMDSVEIDIKEIKIVQLENRVIPVIEDMQQYQMDVYKRYHEGTELFEEKIALIDLTAKTVAKHSVQIQEIQAKMA